ncbi:hypothetical protein NHQ30_006266 [Ciborinia camelliae]|nr:hypothetical protein NHQ30_006266 [Ciborinia camelliae]
MFTRKSFLAKVSKNQSSTKSSETLANSCERGQPRKNPELDPKMFREKIPQYDYSNAECRFWIAAQLRSYYILLSHSAATRIADNFIGVGATMFAMEREGWVNMLGNHGNVIRFCIRRIVWNEKKAMKAGLSEAEMNDLRGEYKPEEESEESLDWDGLYSIR